MALCFAIMPITVPSDTMERYSQDPEHFKRVAEYIFRPAAEAADMEFLAPASASSEIIQAEIIQRLEHADLVLCDISTWNANVFFELGIRVALDKPVAIVRDHHTPRIPFDTSMLNAHTYNSNMAVWSVKDEIPKLTAHITSAKSQTQNALWKYFGITQRAERTDTGDPTDAKLDVLMAEFAEFRRQQQAQGIGPWRRDWYSDTWPSTNDPNISTNQLQNHWENILSSRYPVTVTSMRTRASGSLAARIDARRIERSDRERFTDFLYDTVPMNVEIIEITYNDSVYLHRRGDDHWVARETKGPSDEAP